LRTQATTTSSRFGGQVEGREPGGVGPLMMGSLEDLYGVCSDKDAFNGVSEDKFKKNKIQVLEYK